MAQNVEFNIKGTSDVPQQVDKAKKAMSELEKQTQAVTKKFTEFGKDFDTTIASAKKALQRLEARGLISSTEEPSSKRAGSSVKRYFALLSRDMCERECPPMDKTSAGLEKLGGQGTVVSPLNFEAAGTAKAVGQLPILDAADLGGHENGCPPETACIDADFEQGDTFFVTPQEEQRSREELKALMDAAVRMWE